MILVRISVVGLEALLILIISICLNKSYAKAGTPLIVKIISITGWFLGLMILVITPMDVFIVLADGESNELMIVWWSILYWSAFALKTFIIPSMIAFLRAPDLSFKDKIRRAGMNILLTILKGLVLAAIFIGLCQIRDEDRERFKQYGLRGTIQGITLLIDFIYLMFYQSYGYLFFPFAILRYVSNERTLIFQLWNISNTHQRLKIEVNNLIELTRKIKLKIDCGLDEELKTEILKRIKEFYVEESIEAYIKLFNISYEGSSLFLDIDEEDDSEISQSQNKKLPENGLKSQKEILLKLRQKVIFCMEDIQTFQYRLLYFSKQAVFAQDILSLKNQNHKMLRQIVMLDGINDDIYYHDEFIMYIWYSIIRPIFIAIFGLFIFLLGIQIMAGEIEMYLDNIKNSAAFEVLTPISLLNAIITPDRMYLLAVIHLLLMVLHATNYIRKVLDGESHQIVSLYIMEYRKWLIFFKPKGKRYVLRAPHKIHDSTCTCEIQNSIVAHLQTLASENSRSSIDQQNEHLLTSGSSTTAKKQ
ncbi:UNKNOWN [Stylonychia lemnae]|uniref:Uncharacterized protein n=1 Tax=Stylonychia lemnae TaxID=5949 RepID=A0A077ZTY5_STYLE|nr:UNKNOWN [Stylonychia lemnae]|eukprot:CDW73358.1 UNKNOWN [Stylonychia lemnae]